MDVSRSLTLLKRASWYEVLFISVIILPFPLFAWTEVLDWLNLKQSKREAWIIGLILVQIVGILVFVAGSLHYRRKLTKLTLILGYLQDNDFKMVGFDVLQEKYPEENLTEQTGRILIRTFPDQVRYAVLEDKKTKKEKSGIARLDQPVAAAPSPPTAASD